MRLSARHQMLGLLVVVLVVSTGAAPLPAPGPQNTKENSIEAYEDGLIIFVPTIRAADKEKSGKDLKREVEYEMIAIPGSVLRREIRQIVQLYQEPSINSGPQIVVESNDYIADFGEVIIPAPPSTSYLPAINTPTGTSLPFQPVITLPSLPSKPAFSLPSKPAFSLPSKPAFSLPSKPITIPIPIIDFDFPQKPDFGDIVSSIHGEGTAYLSGAGETLAEVGEAGTQVLGQVAGNVASNGVSVARWLIDQKSGHTRKTSQVIAEGLQFAGQLSAGVLRALLQVPGIKARVLSEIIEAGEPLVYAISDVIAESATDLGDHFEAKTSILSDALSLIIRIIQDTLALKGRILFSLGSQGLDIGATAFNAGVRIGGALVETATNVGGAVAGGVSELVEVGKSVDLPPLPNLPPISIPSLPNIDLLPNIDIPKVDLSRLIPQVPALAPLPLPALPEISFTNVQLPGVSLPSFSKPSVSGVSLPSLPTPSVSQPVQLYNTPGKR